MSDPTIDQIEPGTVLEEDVSFEDFVRRYEGQRVEWHAGKVVAKVTNNTQHNAIVFFLAQVFSFYLSMYQLGRVVTDGVPLYIDSTIPAREPDLMVLLNDHLQHIKDTHVISPADIVVEVISPGSGSIDRGAKFDEYEQAGIPEYWLIDPIRKQADVYTLTEEGVYHRTDHSGGKLASQILTAFEIDQDILWQEVLPEGMEIVKLVQEMTTA